MNHKTIGTYSIFEECIGDDALIEADDGSGTMNPPRQEPLYRVIRSNQRMSMIQQ
jgi:hypothetical protein